MISRLTGTDLTTLVRPNEEPIKRLPIENCFEDEFKTLEPNVQSLYEYDATTRTYRLPNENWLKCRQHGEYFDNPSDPRYIKTTIGGSDLAALFDGSELAKQLYLYEGQHGSPYKSAIELFYEKTEQELPMVEEKPEDVFFTGHVCEEVVRQYFKRCYEKDHPGETVTIINDPHMYQCGRRNADGTLALPFVLCDLDSLAVISTQKYIIECKTCNYTSEDYPLWKQHVVPLKYYLQVCWYMLCMNIPCAYICCCTGLSLSDFIYIYIERDFAIEDAIIEMAKQFIDCVENGVEPTLTGQNLDRLYTFWRKKMGPFNEEKEQPVKLDDSKLDAVRSILSINTDIEDLKKKISALEKKRKKLLVEEIFPVFRDANFGTVMIDSSSYYSVKLKKSSTRGTFDEEKLKAENPALYARYLTTVEKFDTALFKKEQKTIAANYMDKSGGNTLTDAKANYCEIEYREFAPATS